MAGSLRRSPDALLEPTATISDRCESIVAAGSKHPTESSTKAGAEPRRIGPERIHGKVRAAPAGSAGLLLSQVLAARRQGVGGAPQVRPAEPVDPTRPDPESRRQPEVTVKIDSVSDDLFSLELRILPFHANEACHAGSQCFLLPAR